jgi:hypothetical protein
MQTVSCSEPMPDWQSIIAEERQLFCKYIHDLRKPTNGSSRRRRIGGRIRRCAWGVLKKLGAIHVLDIDQCQVRLKVFIVDIAAKGAMQ